MECPQIIENSWHKAIIPRLVQALNECDPGPRMEFAECFLKNVSEVWWSDEATFKMNGYINRNNYVYWSTDNPNIVIEKELNLPGVTVWSTRQFGGPIWRETIWRENK